MNQTGGGKCSICGSEGGNKRTCPLNKDAVNINYESHPAAAARAPVPAAEALAHVAAPKPKSKAKAKPVQAPAAAAAIAPMPAAEALAHVAAPKPKSKAKAKAKPVQAPAAAIPIPIPGPCPPIGYKLLTSSSFVRKLNCLELPLENIKFILGPCLFYQFKLADRNIYLFGEAHNMDLGKYGKQLQKAGANAGNTLLFPSFVHSLAKQNPGKTYDLMVELRESKPFKPGSLRSIFMQFEDCLRPKQRGRCGYTNLRTHYVDFRHDIRNTVDSSLPIKTQIETLLKDGRALKQIKAIRNLKVRKAFINFINDMVTKEPEKAQFHNMAVMDIYAIARALRHFSTAPKPSDNKAFKGNAQNVLYYAGYYHVLTFVDFLSKYLGLKPEYSVVSAYEPLAIGFKMAGDCQSFLPLDISKTSLLS